MSSTASGASTSQPCTQPGCTGTIVDGYCDVCGNPPGAAPAAATTPKGSPADSHDDTLGSSPSGKISTASGRLASAPIGSARAAGRRTTRRTGTISTRLRGPRLGAGITTVPAQPVLDPSAAIMKDPQVPEEKRYCPHCNHPVGRSRAGRPGRPEGFCPNCGNRFSFTPKLKPGDMVGGQYEVAGCLAHGGLGWVYLARDRNVSDRWVVLKGLLNSGDPDALAAAIAERQFLAQVEHPLIVEIYNFVSHDGAGYIVMEYIGGTSLKTLLKNRMIAAGHYDAIPVDQAIAYVVEVLPAFQYLHDMGLLYCDFKPDNIIQVGEAVKLIDLGGVRRVDDTTSAIYGTVGYQAPEVPEVGPSVASDIFTIGRSLAVLTFEFRGYQSTYATTLPPVDDVPLFQQQDSFHRLLLKACAPDPADRFASADELRVQLLGVLREIVATAPLRSGGSFVAAGHSVPSALFNSPVVEGEDLEWHHLPELRVDDGDPMASWLSTLSVVEPKARLEALVAAPQTTPEVLLAIARTAIDAQAQQMLDTAVTDLLTEDPWEWRAVWMQGLAQLARGDAPAARSSFNAVYGQVPGELAAKLALALSCERSNEPDIAERLYTTCAAADATYVAPAALGMARIRAGRKDLTGAVAALDLVPATSRAYVDARRRRAGLLAGSGAGLVALSEALRSIEAVTIDPLDRARLTTNVLDAALRAVLKNGPDKQVTIAGHPADEKSLRDGLEGAYRTLAVMTNEREERVRLVDSANQIRRWTLR